ncbi:MAG TPA: hypothetical protein VI456_02085 [Polyangia bacterium]
MLLLTGASGVARAASSSADGASGTDGATTKKKTSRKPSGKKAAPKSKGSSSEAKTARAQPTRLARQKSGHGSPETINENVTLTPFPSHPEAAKKALAQNRRDQLDDAEKAARSPDQADRWQTVLFHLRNLDARSDPEGCFWRLVAYYRLGQMERARTLRQACELGGKDAALIETEDEQAARIQPPTALADKEPPAVVANPAPYAGAAPARLDR